MNDAATVWVAAFWFNFWCVNQDGVVIDTSPVTFEGEPPDLYVGFRLSVEEASEAAASSPKKWGRRFVKRCLYPGDLPEPALALTNPFVFPELFSDRERAEVLGLALGAEQPKHTLWRWYVQDVRNRVRVARGVVRNYVNPAPDEPLPYLLHPRERNLTQ